MLIEQGILDDQGILELADFLGVTESALRAVLGLPALPV